MKGINFILLILFVFQFSYSQTEKLFKGKVFCENYPIKGVDIINVNTRKITMTDNEGYFFIVAKSRDVIFFISKKHDEKKIILSQEDTDNNNFSMELVLKPIELDGVVINKKYLASVYSDQNFSDKLKLEKAQANPKNPFVYDGTIVNGMDFIRMGKDFSKLIRKIFKVESKVVKKINKIEFKEYVASNFNQDFFINKLKLQPEEIALFLDFCDADSKSKTLIENINILSTMDFLFTKNIEFKKL